MADVRALPPYLNGPQPHWRRRPRGKTARGQAPLGRPAPRPDQSSTTTARCRIHSPSPRRIASATRRLRSATSNRPPQGQSRGLAAPPLPGLPPLGEHRSGGGTSRSTRTQRRAQSRRCRVQRMMVVTQLYWPTTRYRPRRLGACDRADAAAAFSDLVLFLLASTLPAAVAALLPV